MPKRVTHLLLLLWVSENFPLNIQRNVKRQISFRTFLKAIAYRKISKAAILDSVWQNLSVNDFIECVEILLKICNFKNEFGNYRKSNDKTNRDNALEDWVYRMISSCWSFCSEFASFQVPSCSICGRFHNQNFNKQIFEMSSWMIDTSLSLICPYELGRTATKTKLVHTLEK